MTDTTVPLPEPDYDAYVNFEDDQVQIKTADSWSADSVHAYAAAVSAADNAALREAADESESLCAAKQSEIDALRELYRSQAERVKVLEAALREVISVTQAGSFASNIARAALEQKP